MCVRKCDIVYVKESVVNGCILYACRIQYDEECICVWMREREREIPMNRNKLFLILWTKYYCLVGCQLANRCLDDAMLTTVLGLH